MQVMCEGVSTTAPIKQRTSFHSDLACRGVASHVRATAAGLGKMVSGASAAVSRKIVHIFSNHIYDDATMWVQRPVQDKQHEFSSSFLEKLEKQQGPKGRNVHLPVFNNVETVYVTGGVISNTSDSSTCEES